MSSVEQRRPPKPRRDPTRSDRLVGKVAIVSGGSTGLGRQIARTYAAAGASVVVGDIEAEDGKQTIGSIRSQYGADAKFIKADVTSGSDVRALVEQTEAEFGRLDIMTANAGVLWRCVWQPLQDIEEDDFDYVLQVNLYGVYRCFKYAIPALMRAGGGARTPTTSLGAHRRVANRDPCSASKRGATARACCGYTALAPLIGSTT